MRDIKCDENSGLQTKTKKSEHKAHEIRHGSSKGANLHTCFA
jgi:hypothetical protein